VKKLGEVMNQQRAARLFASLSNDDEKQ